MATRSTRGRSAPATRATTSATSAPAPGLDVFGIFTDLPRRQLALASYSTTALVRGTQELRRIQMEAAQRAMQETVRYWQQLADAAIKLQADIMSSAGEAVAEGASEPTLAAFQRAVDASFDATAAGAGAAH